MADNNRLIELMAEMLEEQRLTRAEMKEFSAEMKQMREQQIITNTRLSRLVSLGETRHSGTAEEIHDLQDRVKQLEEKIYGKTG